MAGIVQMSTCTMMIYTDGTISRYAVMKGLMKRKSFNAHNATTIAVYEITSTPNYVDMTSRHATIEAPAVPWQT